MTDEADVQKLGAEWLSRIRGRETAMKPWFERAEKIYKRFKDERAENELASSAKMNVLWSNVKTLQPALYARPPKPLVSRRYDTGDPTVRLAAQVLERSLAYLVEQSGLDDAVKMARDDYLLSGRGTLWVRYVPEFGDERRPEIPVTQTDAGGYISHDGSPVDDGNVEEREGGPVMLGEPYRPKTYDRISIDTVLYCDLVHPKARDWRSMPWIARRAEMTKEELKQRWPDKCHLFQMGKPSKPDGDDGVKCATVYEVWNKTGREVLWLSPEFKDTKSGELVERIDDPLGLREFFPCPKPIFATVAPDSLIPVPDFAMYQDQAAEIDLLTERIKAIGESIRVTGAYNANLPELAQIFTTADNTLVPSSQWAVLAQAGGLAGQMDILNIDPMIKALGALYEAREQAKQIMFEVSGIADVMRGQTDPNETLGAQELKGSWGSLRLDERQKEIAELCRSAISIMAEIVCAIFDPGVILQISGFDRPTKEQEQQLPAAIALLKDDATRGFVIDVETDSTIAPDEEKEKAARVEFLTATGGFLEKALPLAQNAPPLAPLLAEMLLFAVRGFRVGRDMEQKWEDALAQIEQAAQQSAGQPPPDPEAEKAKAEMEIKQVEVAARKQEAEAKMALEQMKIEAAKEQHAMDMEIETLRLKGEKMKIDAQGRMLDRQMMADRQRHDMAMNEHREDRETKTALANAKQAPVVGVQMSGPVEEAILQTQSGTLEAVNAVARSVEQLAQGQAITATAMVRAAEAMTRPRRLVRDSKTGEKRVEVM